jgi:hypothetical protein
MFKNAGAGRLKIHKIIRIVKWEGDAWLKNMLYI